MNSFRFPLLGVYLLALSSFGSAVVHAQPARAQGLDEARHSELILTNLPPKGSRAYRDLLALAGKDVYGQVLGLTQSEVWSAKPITIDLMFLYTPQVAVKVPR